MVAVAEEGVELGGVVVWWWWWCLGLNTWKALPLPPADPGLLSEDENGRTLEEGEGEERGDVKVGRNPTIPGAPSAAPDIGEPMSTTAG